MIKDVDATAATTMIKDKLNCKDLDATEFDAIMPFLQGDKKNRDGHIVFSLPAGIGSGTYGISLSMADVKI